jgi:DNA polymerase (family X)
MTNAEIAAALDELADLNELDGAVVYRVVAYRQAARAVRESPIAVEQLLRQGRLTSLKGVGKTIEEKIGTLLETGEIPAAAKLKSKFPAGLVAFTQLPGLGPKTARKVYEELGISTLDELREAARAERLRDIPGLGAKVEQRILEALESPRPRKTASGRQLLSQILPIAETIVAELRAHPAAERVEIAGSARRMTETCKDVDIVAAAHDPLALAEALTGLDVVLSAGRPSASGVRVKTNNGVSVDLRIVSPEQFGSLLHHLTGSKQHNMAVRDYAVRRGLHVSEYGIEDDSTGEKHPCATEEEVYERLGLDYIEPELREGRGEVEAALEHRLPKLIELEDLKGDLHCHTTASDGRNSLEEMAETAHKRGYSYLAITDHSASFGFGDDVQPEELRRQVERVRELNRSRRGFKLLIGSEVNILPDGSLDYEDDVLAELDWVIASVHSSFRQSEKAKTERMMAAMDHPLVDAIGHPTGRLIGRRDPYPLDIERIVEHAAATKTMLEINSNPDRRDLSDLHARLAAEAAVMLVINSDSHGVETQKNIRYGIANARRAGLAADSVANTRPLRDFKKLCKRAQRAKRISRP